MKHRIVFHLAKGYEVGKFPTGRVGSTSDDRLPEAVELPPVARGRPAIPPLGQEVLITLQGVVVGVEEILHIEFHHRQPCPLRQGLDGQNRQEEQEQATPKDRH